MKKQMSQSTVASSTIAIKGVFISYRRDGGSEVARIIADYLESSGYEVFLDVDSLGGGHFDEMILREIDKNDTFILICSPECFARCHDPEDWVRRELERALEKRKKIIPVTLGGAAGQQSMTCLNRFKKSDAIMALSTTTHTGN